MNKMFRLKIEMFGLPSDVTSLRSIDVTLNDGAVIAELVFALRKAIPALEGKVIRTGEDRLIDNYTFNINGHFFAGNYRIELKAGDSIKLLMLATGG
jgi:hypothetical protein